MASDEPSSGLSLPQWVKSKFGDRNNSQQTTTPRYTESNSSLYYFRYIPEPDPSSETKMDATPQSTMKRSSTSPDTQLETAAAAEGSSGSSSFYNILTGKLFGNYLSADKNKEEYKNLERRNSKSLPASPVNSPRIYRRNPYFTDPFLRPDEKFDSNGRPFLYFSLSSQRTSLESLLGLVDPNAPPNDSSTTEIPKNGRVEFVPRPSEYRELNCWSPVSM